MLYTIQTKVLLRESKILFLLALPLIASGLVEHSVGFFSTYFLAQLGQEALAAGALVGWMFATLLVIMWGTLSATSTMVSHRHGAQDYVGVARVLRDALILASIAAIPCMLLIWNLAPLLTILGQRPETVTLAIPYLHALTWAIFPDFIFTVLLHFIVGLGHTRTNLFFTLLWVPINIFLNYVLIFGKFGLPAFGIAGIGWGMSISFWLFAILTASYLLLSKRYRIYYQHLMRNTKNSTFAELSRIGLPMGLMFCIEIAFFTCITLLMGTISKHALAANQIVMQYLGQLSVVSFCLAQAVTVRMGHRLGAGDSLNAERAGYLGILMATLFMCSIAIIYWFYPTQLIGIDLDLNAINNQPIIDLAKKFLMICACFQIAESIRITAFGALRALKDTRFTLLISILTFWGIAIPLGYILTRVFKMDGSGLWWATVLGQCFGAVILIVRYRNKMKTYASKLAS